MTRLASAAMLIALLAGCGDGGGSSNSDSSSPSLPSIGAVDGWPDPLSLEWGAVPDGEYVVVDYLELMSSWDGGRWDPGFNSVAPWMPPGAVKITEGRIDGGWWRGWGHMRSLHSSAPPVRLYADTGWFDDWLPGGEEKYQRRLLLYFEGGMASLLETAEGSELVLFGKMLETARGSEPLRRRHDIPDEKVQVVRMRLRKK